MAPAVVAAVAIIVLAIVGSALLIESDPLGVLAAGVLVLVAIGLLIAIYIGHALIRSSRKARDNDHFANPS